MTSQQAKIRAHANSAEAVWGDAYNIIWKVINKKKLKVGVEVGVAFGGHSEAILANTRAKLYCVDPYQHIRGYDDPMNKSQAEFNELYTFATNRLKKFKNRAIFIRKKSHEAVKEINKLIDFVYIDADHSYEGVSQDIAKWFFKIRDGGIISGHDYNHPNFPGVKVAVDEFFNRFNWELHTDKSGVWWVEKKVISISYIMPAFNAEETITESVESIYKGNFSKGDEVIIVDDGSTDKTKVIVRKLQKKYKNIQLLINKKNQGGGASRNIAVMNSKNDFIFCLDSDNILIENSIGKLKSFLIEEVLNAACFKRIKFFKINTKNPSHSWEFSKEKYTVADHFKTGKVPSSSGNYLYTKHAWRIVGGYPEHAKALDTWGFGFSLSAHEFNVGVLNDLSYWHRLREKSYWVTTSKTTNYSTIATGLVKFYKNKIDKSTFAYITSLKHKNSWFENMPVKAEKIENKFSLAITNVIKNLYSKKISHNGSFKKKENNKYIVYNAKMTRKWNKDLQRWFDDKGDLTKRITYSLDKNSIVFDVGGYEGQWASDIYAKYQCSLYVFEPVKKYYTFIKNRFKNNSKINVYKVALAGEKGNTIINVFNENSSLINDFEGEKIKKERIDKTTLKIFMNQNSILKINLLKINIEGEEYDLLDSIIKDELLMKIDEIQVQFHLFAPNARTRRNAIVRKLSETHERTYNYPFIWENWRKK